VTARRETRGRSGPGWLSTLLGVLVLCSVGFLGGLVAGLVFENPRLVAGELAGRSEEVALAPADAPDEPAAPAERSQEEAGAEDRVAARAPRGLPAEAATRATPRPQRESAAAPSRRPAVASPPPQGTWLVQVGAFSDSRVAEKLAGDLRAKGFAVRIAPGAAAGDGRWRVRVGPVGSRPEAEELAARLKSQERLPTWVLNGAES
jgi:cell division septation protein DedD